VNVWATWCVPCREEFPLLLRLAREYEPRGLELLLVSADFDDRLPAVRRFLAAQGVTDTSYLKAEDDMSFIDALSPRWSGALPATFVYDGAGRQIAFWEGKADEARLRKSLEEALAKRSSMEDSSP
jgi:thiol-disulfide isomerase/thioredoxin